MGIKSSLFITFENAQKRSTPREFERWTKGFQRLCPNEKILEKQHSQLFAKEVLGNNVSKELGDRIFRVFACNTEVMTVEDFVCGMVVLLKGTYEEKLKFVFYIYESDQQGFVTRDEVEKVLSSVDMDKNRNNTILDKCFPEINGKIYTHEWKKWVSENRNTGVPLVSWIYELPSDVADEEESSSEEGEEDQKDVDLNAVTSFKQEEIELLSKQYDRLFALRSYHARLKKGKFIDRGTIVKLFAPPLPDQLAFHLFNAFVKQGGEFIDFTDFVRGMSMCCRGSIEERLRFIYDVFEITGEEKMSRAHLYTMFRLIWQIEGTPLSNPKGKETKEEGPEVSPENDPVKTFVDKVFIENKSERSEFMTKEDFIKWAQTQEDVLLLLETLKYIVNVNVGLPPSEPSEERDIIKQLIEYHKKNMRAQDVWHIINARWWKQWTTYVNYDEDNLTITPQPQHPGVIDNSGLIQKKVRKWGIISYITGETRPGDDAPKMLLELLKDQDYVLLPASAGKALSYWYGCQITLTCKVIAHGKNLEIEVYPLNLVFKVEPPLILPGKRVEYAEYPFSKITPLNELKRRACFQIGVSTMSKIRLWSLDENGTAMSLEGDLDITLEDAKIEQGQTIVLERQNRDNTWPRGGPENAEEEAKAIYAITPGIAGLRNLGNTCFMNSSLQALSHTHILTNYFISNRYVPEINRDNLLGMNGHVAKEYGAVVHELWPVDPEKKSVTKNYVVVPRDLKYVIGKFAPQFSGFQQHDAQEFLAFLLDGLHEDLNRVLKKPYIQNPDYKGQPDRELAQAFWDTYLLRNQSIVVDLFAGQLKSTILSSCGRKSITFDPFTFLSLPLPIDAKRSVEIFFFYSIRQDRPVKVSVLVDREEGSIQEILNQLSEIVKVDPRLILLASVHNHYIFDVIRPWDRLTAVNDVMHAYELIGPPAAFLAPAVEPLPVEVEQISLDVNSTVDTDPQNNMQQDLLQQEPSNQEPKPMEPNPNLTNQDSKLMEQDPNLPNQPKEQDPNLTIQDPKPIDHSDPNDIIFIRVIHRKVQRTKFYFTSPYTSTLFSSPTIVSFHKTKTTNLTLYQLIGQLFNFMIQKEEKDIPLHQKKTDSNNSENEPPFTLKYVNASGTLCSRSPWYSFNIGTLIPPDNKLVDLSHDEAIAVDWKPDIFTLKYLRIDNPHGNWYDEHPSVKENWDNLNKPISLDQCLHWFTQEEDLGDDLFCPNCEKKEKTKKKMEIWKPPPMLIIHLKRFSLYNNRWIKSNRLVNFPLTELDPSSWLVEPPEHPLTYDLYACVNHFGRLGGGHYTAYAVNANDGNWYSFDDNFVKPVEDTTQIVSSAAYLLFYKLRGVESEHVLKGSPPSGELNVDKIVGKLPIKDNNSGNNKHAANDFLEKTNCVVS